MKFTAVWEVDFENRGQLGGQLGGRSSRISVVALKKISNKEIRNAYLHTHDIHELSRGEPSDDLALAVSTRRHGALWRDLLV